VVNIILVGLLERKEQQDKEMLEVKEVAAVTTMLAVAGVPERLV
jgi:hypothetical protein